MNEFKPTPNRYKCDHADECNADCLDKDSHPFMHYCLMACDKKGGIAGAVCEPIPLSGAELISDERRRQIEVEGWNTKHDDSEHDNGGLALAGTIYAIDVINRIGNKYVVYPPLREAVTELLHWGWPWDYKFWKPTPDDPIRQLTKAGALIAAEIDRLQRQKDKENVR